VVAGMVDPNREHSEARQVRLGTAGASSPPPVFGFENRRGRDPQRLDPQRLSVARQFLSADGGTGGAPARAITC
jgi:hypothetical protein